MTKDEANGYYGEDGFVWWLYLENKQTLAASIVSGILRDLTDRRGLSHEFNGCDCEIKKEIVDSWLTIATTVLGRQDKVS